MPATIDLQAYLAGWIVQTDGEPQQAAVPCPLPVVNLPDGPHVVEIIRIDELPEWRRRHGLQPADKPYVTGRSIWPPFVIYEHEQDPEAADD